MEWGWKPVDDHRMETETGAGAGTKRERDGEGMETCRRTQNWSGDGNGGVDP